MHANIFIYLIFNMHCFDMTECGIQYQSVVWHLTMDGF